MFVYSWVFKLHSVYKLRIHWVSIKKGKHKDNKKFQKLGISRKITHMIQIQPKSSTLMRKVFVWLYLMSNPFETWYFHRHEQLFFSFEKTRRIHHDQTPNYLATCGDVKNQCTICKVLSIGCLNFCSLDRIQSKNLALPQQKVKCFEI